MPKPLNLLRHECCQNGLKHSLQACKPSWPASEKQRWEQAGELKQRDLKIQQLTLELAYYKRIKFGAKSESLSVEQQDLFLESCNEDQAAISAELAQLQGAIEKSRPKPTGRKAIPPELPRIEHRHEPASCTCGQCGAGLIKIGEDVSEQLDVEPARFFVHRHIRPQYACRTRETITAVPVAPALIDGGSGGTGAACLGADPETSGSSAVVPD